MQAFKVEYKGMYLGGIAIVWAESGDEARRMVEQDGHTQTVGEFRNVKVEALGNCEAPRVLYNWNGDY